MRFFVSGLRGLCFSLLRGVWLPVRPFGAHEHRAAWMGPAARRAERVSQRAWRRRVPLHARATSCALVRAEAAVCGSGGASALRACRLHCVGVSAARAMAVDAIFGCIRLLRTATMHEFEAALHLWRWASLLGRHALLFGSHGCERIFYRGRQKTWTSSRPKAPRVSLAGALSCLREAVLTY